MSSHRAFAIHMGLAVWLAASCQEEPPPIALGIEGAAVATLAEVPVPPVRAVGVSAGVQSACAVMDNGNVWCWGKRLLGRDDTTPRTNLCGNRCDDRPVRVQELADITQVAVGFVHACALSRSGTVFCWGATDGGRLGTGFVSADAGDRGPAPVAGIGTVREISTSWNHTCARNDVGEIWCWGESEYGAFDGIVATHAPCAHGACVPAPVRVPLPPAIQVSAGAAHSCAVTEDGSIWCWGQGHGFLLPDGNECEPQPCGGRPSRLGGIPPAEYVATGRMGNCALLRTGHLYCWGAQVNRFESSPRDPRPPGLPAARAVVTTGQTTMSFCALGRDLRVHCWGYVFIPVRGIFGDIFPAVELPQAAGAQKISMGSLNTCAVGPQGAVLCWGSNDSGQLGLGHTSEVFRPALVRFDR